MTGDALRLFSRPPRMPPSWAWLWLWLGIALAGTHGVMHAAAERIYDGRFGNGFTTTDQQQVNVFAFVTDTRVVMHATRRAFASPGSPAMCQSVPLVLSVLDGVLVGNLFRSEPMAVDFLWPSMVVPSPPWRGSQSFVLPTPSVACDDPGRDVVYIGSGMFRHQQVRQGGGAWNLGWSGGTAALGLAIPGGAWDTYGWANATMHFGGRETDKGWIGFNVTEDHPFSWSDQFVGWASFVVDLHRRLTLQGARIAHRARHSNEVRSFDVQQVVFLPEYAFLDLPDAAWAVLGLDALQLNAHNATSLDQLGDLVLHLPLTVDGRAVQQEVPVLRDRMVVKEYRDRTMTTAERFLGIRRSESANTVVVGCAMLGMSFFVDAASFAPAPPQFQSTQLGTVHGSLSRVDRLEHVSHRNAYVFTPFLLVCVAMWVLTMQIHNVRDNRASMFAARAPVAYRRVYINTSSTIGLVVQVVGVALGIASTVMNGDPRHITMRYKLLFAETTDEAMWYSAVSHVMGILWGVVCIAMVLSEVAWGNTSAHPLRQNVSHFAPNAAHFPEQRRHSPRRRHRALCFPWAVASGDHRSLMLHHLSVWNLHSVLKEIGFVNCVAIGLVNSLMEGAPKNHNVFMIFGAVTMMVLVPATVMVSIGHMLWLAVFGVAFRASWWNVVQVTACVLLNVVMYAFIIRNLMFPVTVSVLQEFDPSTNWLVCLMFVGAVVAIPVLRIAHMEMPRLPMPLPHTQHRP